MRRFTAITTWIAISTCLFANFADAKKLKRYLIASQPTLKAIKYLDIDEAATSVDNVDDPWRPLIPGSLSYPGALATDQRNGLYVADRDSATVYRFQLEVSESGLRVIGDPQTIANGETSWVSADDSGNVFFTDETRQEILGVSAQQVRDGDATPYVLFNSSTAPVNNPAGIVSDNFHVHWANSDMSATVVKGVQPHGDKNLAPTIPPSVVAKNSNKAVGVCETPTMLYYTGETTFIWGVNKNGGNIGTISDKVSQPKQCAYDGDGTVFLADFEASKIFSFAGNMRTPQTAALSKVADISMPFGVAVVSTQPYSSFSPNLSIVFVVLSALLSYFL